MLKSTVALVSLLSTTMVGVAHADVPACDVCYAEQGCDHTAGSFPCELFTSQDVQALKSVIDQVKSITDAISTINSAVAVGVQVAQFLGILDAAPDPYAAIYAHLDDLGLQITNLVERTNINNFVAYDRGDISILKNKLDHGEPIVRDENIDRDTIGAVNVALLETAWERLRADAGTEKIDGSTWKQWISDRAPADDNGFDWDWRIGMPALIDFINMRLQVISAIASTTDHTVTQKEPDYRAEIVPYRNFLAAQRDKMVAGIRCMVDHPDMTSATNAQEDAWNTGSFCTNTIVCADINTGITAISGSWSCLPTDPSYDFYCGSCYLGDDNYDQACLNTCTQNNSAIWSNYFDGQINPTRDAMFNGIKQQMNIAGINSVLSNLDTLSGNRKDFNGDGQTDILLWNAQTGEVEEQLLNGTVWNASATLNSTAAASTGWSVVGTGDFNGDGQTDVLWYNSSTGDIGAWLLDTTTTVVGWRTVSGPAFWNTAGSGWAIKGTADFDGDGKPDLLWHHGQSGAVAVWYLDGMIAERGDNVDASAADSTGWEIDGTGDFNNDGHPDILWHHGDSGLTAAWLLTGAHVTSYPVFSGPAYSNRPASTGWQIAGTGDYNNDGSIDLLWHNNQTGNLEVWSMNGLTATAASLVTTSNGNPYLLPGSSKRKIVSR